MSDYSTIVYEAAASGVARIVLNCPDARNAQNWQMTYELDAAFNHAVQDASVNVIILVASDPHFSSGDDRRGDGDVKPGETYPVVSAWGRFARPCAHGRFAREQEIYLRNTRRRQDPSGHSGVTCA